MLDRFNESLDEADVEIGDEVCLLKAEDAKKLLEPPRLARLTVRPEHPVLKPGEQASFTCSGQDQYGQPYGIPPVEWSATGGTISAEGLFTAGNTGGLFAVRAKIEGVEAIGEVRVSTQEEPPLSHSSDGGSSQGRGWPSEPLPPPGIGGVFAVDWIATPRLELILLVAVRSTLASRIASRPRSAVGSLAQISASPFQVIWVVQAVPGEKGLPTAVS